MTRSRKEPPLRTKLAACIAQLFLTHDEAVALSEEQVISLVTFDHFPIPHAEDGPDVHWNLQAMLKPGHKKKTAEVDIPGIAKRKRVTKEHLAFQARMLTPRDERPIKKSRWGSRPFAKKC